MKLDNRKMICAVIAFMMVCLLYPFSGKTVCAAERISAEKPCAGQQNTYTYSGSEAVWTVPATGFYKIECYGAGGARGVGGIEGGGQNTVSGDGGDSVTATVLLSKGSKLQIAAGSSGSQGTWDLGDDCYVHGGSGGYPDGGKGEEYSAFNSGGGNRHRWAVGGGGGGSSSVKISNHILASAKGGNGGQGNYTYYDDEDEKKIRGINGGFGGGVTQITDDSTYEATDTENVNGINGGNGYVVITVIKIGPVISLKPDTEEWTKNPVTINAAIESEGQGLDTASFISWETDAEGNDIWTEGMSCVVTENGAYTCKIKDIEGNTGECTIEITHIDRLEPEVELVTDVSGWTKDKFMLSASAADASSTNADGQSDLDEKAYAWGYSPKEDSSEEIFGEWTGETSYPVEENGIYYCKVRDRAGNIKQTSCPVTNVDVTPPKASYHTDGKWYGGKTTITVTGEDLQPDGSPGCGLAEKAYSLDGITFDEALEIEVSREESIFVWIKDTLGNIGKNELAIKYDKKESGGSGCGSDGHGSQGDASGSDTSQTGITDRLQNPETIQEPVPPLQEPAIMPQETLLPRELLEELSKREKTASSAGRNQGERKEKKVKEAAEEISVGEIAPEELAGAEELLEAVIPDERKEEAIIIEEKPPTSGIVRGIEGDSGKHLKTTAEIVEFVLYSVWVSALLCGLFWMFFSLIFEHAVVYCKNKKGKYEKIGRCAIFRKKEYKQVNLSRLMTREEGKEYQLRFSRAFALLHKKKKVLIRTWNGVELRNIERKIEI